MTAKEKEKGFATRAIHVGQEPDPLTGAVSVPIYPTSTYVQEEIGKNRGYEYARVSNPTRDRLEENLASLEGGIGSKVFASGMAAINAIATMGKSETVNGWISDSKCGAKGANASAADCTKKCLAEGASVVVVTDKDQKILAVDNPDALKGHEGHHVAVTGHVEGDKVHVESVKML